ncbi:MAG: permease-like cell division protein FtsX [Egibacteraceae bacterium]
MGPRWRYLASEVGIGLKRNLLMTLATIVTVTVSLALLGAGVALAIQVNKAERLLYAQVEVSIFLNLDVTPDQRDSLQSDLDGNPLVEEIIYVSQEQAFEEVKEIFSGDEAVLNSVEPDILPASFRVKLTDPEQYEVVASQFDGYPGVDEVVDQREVLQRFFQIMGLLQRTAIVVALVQGVAAAALIANTIRITAFARREQIGIMKLVGATNWYIRLPFIIEGVIAGVIGALLAGTLLVLGQVYAVGRLRGTVQFIPFITTGEVVTVIPLLVVIGAAVAVVAAFLSLWRFLDV